MIVPFRVRLVWRTWPVVLVCVSVVVGRTADVVKSSLSDGSGSAGDCRLGWKSDQTKNKQCNSK